MSDLKNLSLQDLINFSNKLKVDGIVIPDGDFFLNEYTAEEDNIRKHLTQFKGSVGQAFLLKNKLHLVVDGRYRIAAKDQFQGDQLDIVDYTPQILPFMIDQFQKAGVKKLGVWFERMSSIEYEKLSQHFEVVDVSELFMSSYSKSAPETLYQTTKIRMNLSDGELFVTHQVDAIARLSGLRSSFFPYMSSIPGLLFVTKSNQTLLTSFPISQEIEGLKIVNVESLLDMSKVAELNQGEKFTVIYDPNVTNQAVVCELTKICSQSAGHSLKPIKEQNSNYMAKKESAELDEFKSSYMKSSLAIWRTLDWARENKTKSVTEIDLKSKILSEFKASGAWRESFHPICGFGANSAIIHYGQPSDQKTWNENEFLLLDCGAYYESGVATDTTRTLFHGSPDDKAILMYSLVLRGLIKAQMSVFSPGTMGSQVDMLAREPLLQFGKNYAHGTGHGIGIHVHEGGYSLNPMSTVGLYEGQVGSIEPGYYEEGWGGIRLENAVIVVKHPTFEGQLTFEPLTYLPFEEELIDRSLFTNKELEYLDQYQEKSRTTLSD